MPTAKPKAGSASHKLRDALLSAHETGDYKNAILACNVLLKHNRQDENALQCKCFCLIQEAQYSDALKIASRMSNLRFEHAYCLYRTGEIAAALQILEGMSTDCQATLKVTHLRAQLLYRLERYSECADIYASLLKRKNEDGDDDMEIRANAIAAFSLADRRKEGDLLMAKLPDLQRHEVSYNQATAMIYDGDYEGGRNKLNESKRLCLLDCEEENYDQGEVNAEVGIIVVQLAFLLQVTGHQEEAHKVYEAVSEQKLGDKTINAVVTNNLLCLNRQFQGQQTNSGHSDSNLFQEFKRSKTRLNALSKLTWRQKEPIQRNHALILLKMGKHAECRTRIQTLLDNSPVSHQLVVLKAACLNRTGDAQNAERILLEFLTTNKDVINEEKLMHVQFALAQVYVITGKYEEAIELLEKMPCSNRPGVIATAANIRTSVAATASGIMSMQITNEQIQKLDAAIHYWRKTVSNEFEDDIETGVKCLVKLTEVSAELLLKVGRWKEAAKRFEDVMNGFNLMKGSDKLAGTLRKMITATIKLRCRAQLAIAYSHVNMTQAERYANALPLAQSVLEVDAEELERMAAPAQRIAARREAMIKARAAKAAAQAREAAEAQRGEGQANLKEIRQSVDPNAKDIKTADSERRKATALKKQKRRFQKRAQRREIYLVELRKKLEESGKIEKGAVLPKCDPERWIARKDRTGWVKGRRRKRIGFVGGGQGGNIAEATAKLDARAIALAAAASGESSVKSNTGKVVKSKKRRKKKGKKGRR